MSFIKFFHVIITDFYDIFQQIYVILELFYVIFLYLIFIYQLLIYHIVITLVIFTHVDVLLCKVVSFFPIQLLFVDYVSFLIIFMSFYNKLASFSHISL